MKAQVGRSIRSRAAAHIVDHSRMTPGEAAIYTLADPRDAEAVRYVGQTGNPRKRFLQHVGAARLWLPDDLPWWVKRPKMLPLYEWIRELHRDEGRLPLMAVVAWTQGASALQDERRLICHCLSRQLPLLNCDATISRDQLLF